MLFDAHDDETEPIWLGRVMPNPEWNGQGVYKNESRGKLSFKGVSIGRGEVAVYVMWYEKINATSDKLEYWVSRTEREPIAQNNRYLISIVVQLSRVLGQQNPVPKLRISTRGDIDRAELNCQKRLRDWHDKEVDVVWEMDLGLRKAALALCDL